MGLAPDLDSFAGPSPPSQPAVRLSVGWWLTTGPPQQLWLALPQTLTPLLSEAIRWMVADNRSTTAALACLAPDLDSFAGPSPPSQPAVRLSVGWWLTTGPPQQLWLALPQTLTPLLGLARPAK